MKREELGVLSLSFKVLLSFMLAVPILLIPWTFGECPSESYQNHTGPNQLLVQSLVLLSFVKYSTPYMPACSLQS